MTTKKIVTITVVSLVIFSLMSATLFFSTPFMLSWGSKHSFGIQVISFLQNTPFNLIDSEGDIHLGFIFLNALFWTICLAGVCWLFLRKK